MPRPNNDPDCEGSTAEAEAVDLVILEMIAV